MSDEDIISPYNINTISSRNVKKGDYLLFQYQILQTNIIRTVWQTIRRTIRETLGVKR